MTRYDSVLWHRRSKFQESTADLNRRCLLPCYPARVTYYFHVATEFNIGRRTDDLPLGLGSCPRRCVMHSYGVSYRGPTDATLAIPPAIICHLRLIESGRDEALGERCCPSQSWTNIKAVWLQNLLVAAQHLQYVSSDIRIHIWTWKHRHSG